MSIESNTADAKSKGPRPSYAWVEVVAGVWMYFGLVAMAAGVCFALIGLLGQRSLPEFATDVLIFIWGLVGCTVSHLLVVAMNIARDARVIRDCCERQTQPGQ